MKSQHTFVMPRSSISSSCDMSDISYPTTFSRRAISIESAAICKRAQVSRRSTTADHKRRSSRGAHLIALEPLERLGKV
jgi:hypothetical protein